MKKLIKEQHLTPINEEEFIVKNDKEKVLSEGSHKGRVIQKRANRKEKD